MKKNVSVSASNGSLSIEVTAKIDSDSYLMRHEVDTLADDLRDRLMKVFPDLRYTSFRLSKLKVS